VRSHHILTNIPVVALTATAVPRVQKDIIKNLQMRKGTTVAKKSFDRSNLKITIRRKPITGNYGVFDALVRDIATAFSKLGKNAYTQAKSTIVYCATKKEVEEICGRITQALAHKITDDSNQTITFSDAENISSTFVKPYHAGLSIGHREDAHTNFLIGKVSIIVATVAFGMGIDKPDIRRVIHWGPCKTVEEYYQQMGRAGRDGLSSECTMYANLSEFSKFKGDFYIGSLRGEAKEATIRSMDALKDFAMSTEGCRRASLLEFFGEKPSFGNNCGTCDLCLEKKQHAGDFERDFQSEGARVILLAVAACPDQSMSTLEKIINGGEVESYRYHSKSSDFPSSVARKVNSARSLMAKKKPLSYFKEIFQPLAQRGFIKQCTRQPTHKYAVRTI
jgi:ATP-dependent DNA helicase RecQ